MIKIALIAQLRDRNIDRSKCELIVIEITGSHYVFVNRPHVPLKVGSLMERLVTVEARILRHLAAFLS